MKYLSLPLFVLIVLAIGSLNGYMMDMTAPDDTSSWVHTVLYYAFTPFYGL